MEKVESGDDSLGIGTKPVVDSGFMERSACRFAPVGSASEPNQPRTVVQPSARSTTQTTHAIFARRCQAGSRPVLVDDLVTFGDNNREGSSDVGLAIATITPPVRGFEQRTSVLPGASARDVRTRSGLDGSIPNPSGHRGTDRERTSTCGRLQHAGFSDRIALGRLL